MSGASKFRYDPHKLCQIIFSLQSTHCARNTHTHTLRCPSSTLLQNVEVHSLNHQSSREQNHPCCVIRLNSNTNHCPHRSHSPTPIDTPPCNNEMRPLPTTPAVQPTLTTGAAAGWETASWTSQRGRIRDGRQAGTFRRWY